MSRGFSSFLLCSIFSLFPPSSPLYSLPARVGRTTEVPRGGRSQYEADREDDVASETVAATTDVCVNSAAESGADPTEVERVVSVRGCNCVCLPLSLDTWTLFCLSIHPPCGVRGPLVFRRPFALVVLCPLEAGRRRKGFFFWSFPRLTGFPRNLRVRRSRRTKNPR